MEATGDAMLEAKILETDILIIGGGAAGCYAALTIAENSDAKVLIAEKAYLKRSGCLAAGVNALNAYLNKGETPESYVEYVKKDAEGVIREDLVYTMAQRLNKVTAKIESLGLPILKDAEGNYQPRGKRSIKINGESIKPILAKAVAAQPNIEVLNRVNVIDYIVRDGQVIGAYGFSLDKHIFYIIYAKAAICATGGASGLYKPNNPGFSRHKMWYPPFNTGAGYGMGIRAGAEMTTLEMRFIALRCKDTIAPTGTIAQGVEVPQVNSNGEEYVEKYLPGLAETKRGKAGKVTTPLRLYATVRENQSGLGPCYLYTTGITQEQEEDLYKAYFNMAPAQTLKWLETGKTPRLENVEIEGTEPYIVGGHAASGYWVDTCRATTLKGLFAAGDVAGGSPKKYVTGCFAEGEIAGMAALEFMHSQTDECPDGRMVFAKPKDGDMDTKIVDKLAEVNNRFVRATGLFGIEEVEQAMQKAMDEYAGGISTGYVINQAKLKIAKKRIQELLEISKGLKAKDLHELMFIYEVIDRLYICQVLIAHLETRQETRWLCYQQNADFPQKDDANWLKYVNSRYEDGEVKIMLREIVKRDDVYEHSDR